MAINIPLLPGLFVGAMTADDAARGRAKNAMMSRIVACDTANNGALQAAFGIGR
jgi:hypothetical protein